MHHKKVSYTILLQMIIIFLFLQVIWMN